MEANVAGIDIGGTMVKGALFTLGGTLLKKKSIKTPINYGKNEIIRHISSLFQILQKGSERILSVGIGIAGVVDKKREVLLQSPNLPGWENFSIKNQLVSEWKIPVFLENDANTAALGEKWAGAAKKSKNFLLFTLGTGIGSGLILNNKLWTGELGKAGEFGHMVVNPEGIRCACGKRGCLEVYGSAEAIKRMAKQALQEGRKSYVRALCRGNLKSLDAKMVHIAAKKGDDLSVEIFKQVARYLAIGISNVNNLLDINTFIVGGGVSNAFDIFKPFLMKEVRRRVFKVSRYRVKILASRLGSDAGIFGAGYLARLGIE